ncbi:adenylate/guanylate cyclase domain-containing protein [Flavobacterium daemonense]|uniref:adenylate/guanylate cyclase domain-containing protein n=1 Tax=Flavobacterium daemonense TaxID=1393049 RepID=UPI001FE803A5|nr:adenylate/guanylate cyclase domain-containing protein [Flavobacterium daemonense]
MKKSIAVARVCFLIAVVCFLPFFSEAQNQKVADSLKKIYMENKVSGEAKLELLRNLSFNEVSDLKTSLKYANELIRLSIKEKNYLYLHRGYLQKGNSYRVLGDLNTALEAYFKSKDAAVQADFPAGEGAANMSIADVYSVMDNAINAQIYYKQAISILRKTTDTISLATALLNAGEEYSKSKRYENALAYYKESGILFKRANYLIGTAYNLGNTGMLYAEQGKDDLAMKNINEAIAILEKVGDYYAISDYLTYMSDIYLKRNNWKKALGYAEESLSLAQKYGLKEQLSNTNLKLSELYQKSGNFRESLYYFKNHIVYRDSVNNIEMVQKMADIRTTAEIAQKQVEVNLLNQQKKTQKIIAISSIISFVLVLLLAFGLYRRYKFVHKTNKIIENERNRSNSLLLNILPEETAAELKETGKVLAKKFESVTVLFTDFEGFTSYSENLSPEKLVKTVDYYFSKFDEIIEKYDLEKIKTVGDSYMCAGGLPYPSDNHANLMLLAALEMLKFVEDSKSNLDFNETGFNIRIGINSGPVVAGVVGTKKFAYDIWGDAVNIASRMESNSESGKINISENTFELIKDNFDCSYRGEIEVKNKGRMKMYFVNKHLN